MHNLHMLLTFDQKPTRENKIKEEHNTTCSSVDCFCLT